MESKLSGIVYRSPTAAPTRIIDLIHPLFFIHSRGHRSYSLIETLLAMQHRQNCLIDDLRKQLDTQTQSNTAMVEQIHALSETVEGLKREREESDAPASLSPSEGVSELAYAKATLLKGFTLNPKSTPIASLHPDAPSALAAIQRHYPNHTLMEAVEERAARMDFSSMAIHNCSDHHSEYRLTKRQFTAIGAWCPFGSGLGQNAQVTFDRPVVVVGVATAGRPSDDQWVTSYKVEVLATDTVPRTWVAAEPDVKEYKGNTDRHTIVLQTFGNPVVAKQVRITPLGNQGHPSMRFEVYAWAY
ncbi:hypothetical protein KIPB_004114 [Kipferlia bialata]|uniref:F5/8 type C domain-containing protein n=1 Tax=Kipferlia bialata TaxID=797122 RepID=A0A9K3CTZ3_9EUKA|nr:hypothetical protein KIPB_004114 [Kipferlia bialata]|eukprot:g4114.t1